MDQLFSHFTDAIETAAAGAFVAACITFIRSRRRRDTVHEDAIKAVVHDSFFRMCRYILPNPDLSQDEMENLDHLYKSYAELGMNGTGEEMYKRCKAKPLRDTIRY